MAIAHYLGRFEMVVLGEEATPGGDLLFEQEYEAFRLVLKCETDDAHGYLPMKVLVLAKRATTEEIFPSFSSEEGEDVIEAPELGLRVAPGTTFSHDGKNFALAPWDHLAGDGCGLVWGCSREGVI